jgi:membrane-associated phospholipid phosphatase
VEADLLLWIHRHASPPLDAVFVVSWVFGTYLFSIALVLLAAAWHLARRQRREALAWVLVGLGVLLLTELAKAAFARPRPTLWPWLLPTSGYAFPSGHALAGMAFYPLLGWLVLRGRGLGGVGYLLGALFGVYVGLGRLYLGVHWPSDVLAGWILGAALSLASVRWVGRVSPP